MRIVSVRNLPKNVDFLARGVLEGALGGLDVDEETLRRLGFTGEASQVMIVPGDGPLIAFVGLGSVEDLDAEVVRGGVAALMRKSLDHSHVGVDFSAAIDEGLDARDLARGAVEGVHLGSYEFSSYRSEPKVIALRRVSITLPGRANVAEAFEMANAVGEAVSLARDFVNEPGGSLTPTQFARRSVAMARKSGLTAKVWDAAAIRKGKLGGLIGVNRGSDNEARLLELSYDPGTKRHKTLALVGKGITFDAGGLSIKTAVGMATMKCDMGGAAAVIGAMSALNVTRPRCAVRAWVPMTDNMLGGDATRPGDVLKIRNGKTIEVLNTDAEGRLVLADGLSLASEASPDAIIDVATLTGACMVALGRDMAGVMGNDDELIESVRAAADVTAERVWQLPLPSSYKHLIESTVADMKNTGGPHAGAITAALLLQEFVADGIAWAHLDVAGPAWTDKESALTRPGGTGFGVRLLVELADRFGRGRA